MVHGPLVAGPSITVVIMQRGPEPVKFGLVQNIDWSWTGHGPLVAGQFYLYM